MLRRLITLLALLTGLAAAGAPAQAMVYDAASGVELVTAAERSCKGEACACARPIRPSFGGGCAAKHRRTFQRVTVFIPTVQLGVDRARE